MENIPIEQITKRFQALNATLQDAIFSQAGTDAILRICALRDVPPEKTALVGQLANRVLLGYLRPENFSAEMQKEAGMDSVKTTAVAHDIDTEIFSTVRLELKKLYPPTVQTPTVQTQGFAPRTPEPPAIVRRPEPARPYVVPIPEKFRTKSIWPSHPTQSAETPTPAPIPTAEAQPTPPAPAPAAPATPPISETKPAPISQSPKIESTPLSDIKPIVPLPTFIQSKFKETLKQTTGEKQATQENPALKSAITQFTTPHTAAKPAEEKPQESIYREALPNEQKQAFPSSSTTQQKAEGKVIDLSGL